MRRVHLASRALGSAPCREPARRRSRTAPTCVDACWPLFSRRMPPDAFPHRPGSPAVGSVLGPGGKRRAPRGVPASQPWWWSADPGWQRRRARSGSTQHSTSFRVDRSRILGRHGTWFDLSFGAAVNRGVPPESIRCPRVDSLRVATARRPPRAARPGAYPRVVVLLAPRRLAGGCDARRPRRRARPHRRADPQPRSRPGGAHRRRPAHPHRHPVRHRAQLRRPTRRRYASRCACSPGPPRWRCAGRRTRPWLAVAA